MVRGKNRRRIPSIMNGVTLLSTIVCVVLGLSAGLAALLAINTQHAWNDGFLILLQGGFVDPPYGIGKWLTNAAPLIMTGLSVGFAYMAGLFNIGAAGQYTLGAFGALFFGLSLRCPWYICLFMSAVFGAAWGSIPGILKALKNVNEVITAIMSNWIGLYAVNELMYRSRNWQKLGSMFNSYQAKTHTLSSTNPAAMIPDLGLTELFRQKSASIAVFIAVLFALLCAIIINKTVLGFQIKMCGRNRHAAKYAGVNVNRSIILSMCISGALAGIGAGLYYLSGAAEWSPLDSTACPPAGFTGISVSLLASNNPIGIIASGLFVSHISSAGTYLPQKYFPSEIADLISGIIIYLCAFSILFKTKLEGMFQRKNTKRRIKEKTTQMLCADPSKGER